MATHSSILAWRIPWREEPGGLQSMGSQRVVHDWSDTCKRTTVVWRPRDSNKDHINSLLQQAFGKKVKQNTCTTIFFNLSSLVLWVKMLKDILHSQLIDKMNDLCKNVRRLYFNGKYSEIINILSLPPLEMGRVGYFLHLLLLYNRKGTRFSLPFLCSNYLFPGAHYGKCGKHFIDSGHHLQQYSSYSGIWQTEEGKRKRSI